MIEKTIEVLEADPQTVYGANNVFLKTLKNFFPQLKITARGNKIKVNGAENLIIAFEEKLALVLKSVQKNNHLTENQLESILYQDQEEISKSIADQSTILHSVQGGPIKAKSINQKKIVDFSKTSDLVFAVGPAGTGKTYTSVALAVRALKNKEVKRIVLTRPAVEAGENLGFLPGDLKDKLDPYMRPLYDALRDMISHEKLEFYLESNVVEIAPLAFMRGRTLDNAFVILDEAQNATHSQMKMFLTRMGKHAKFIITGDISQIDLPRKQTSGLVEALQILDEVEGISIVKLNDKDVIRHRLVKDIIKAYDREENE